jgi:hypothetical protein
MTQIAFRRKRLVMMSPALPESITSCYHHHTVVVELGIDGDQRRYTGKEQSVRLELESWCDLNCEEIYSITSTMQYSYLFQFFLKSDMIKFEQHLALIVQG